MIRTTARYFDGISSIPQKVELLFDEATCIFHFEIPVIGYTQWATDEIVIEPFETVLNIHYKQDTSRFIKLNDAEFINQLNLYLKEKGKLSWYQRVIHLGFKVHLAIAITTIIAIALAYSFLIPLMAEKAVVLIPERFDNEIGQTFYADYVLLHSIDSAKTATLQQFANQLNMHNNKVLHFTVIKSNEVNAFSLPDGNVVVFTGIIESMKDYDELTGLIGHEVSHINFRHSMKMICRDLSGSIFISVMLNDANGVMSRIGQGVHNLASLSYSRKFEQQADLEGLNLMIDNHINPVGMTDLFMRLKLNTDKFVPEFISSHPVTHDRIEYIKKAITKSHYQVMDHPKLKSLFQEIKR